MCLLLKISYYFNDCLANIEKCRLLYRKLSQSFTRKKCVHFQVTLNFTTETFIMLPGSVCTCRIRAIVKIKNLAFGLIRYYSHILCSNLLVPLDKCQMSFTLQRLFQSTLREIFDPKNKKKEERHETSQASEKPCNANKWRIDGDILAP